MPISIEADSTLPQGYLKVNGVTAATVTSTGLTTASLQDNAVTTAKVVNAAITPAKLAQPYTLATAQASTSGTSIDFTGIPSWAKRITIMFNGVSTNGTSPLEIRLGSGSITSSGYAGTSTNHITGTDVDVMSTGFRIGTSSGSFAASIRHGIATILNLTSNTWVFSATVGFSNTGALNTGNGSISLSGTLDRIRITTVNGTDTFDAGTINIAYEG